MLSASHWLTGTVVLSFMQITLRLMSPPSHGFEHCDTLWSTIIVNCGDRLQQISSTNGVANEHYAKAQALDFLRRTWKQIEVIIIKIFTWTWPLALDVNIELLLSAKRPNLAPRSREPFAFAGLVGGAVLAILELSFRIAVVIRDFLHGIVAESTAEHFARLNARPALCRTLRKKKKHC